MRRNADKLRTSKGFNFSQCRSEWCVYSSFELMYDNIYEMLVHARDAIIVDHPGWKSLDDEVVSNVKSNI